MKGNGNNMTEWYGIGKIEDPEAGYVLPSGWGEQQWQTGLLGTLLYIRRKSGIRECGVAEHRRICNGVCITRKLRLHVCACMVAGRRAQGWFLAAL